MLIRYGYEMTFAMQRAHAYGLPASTCIPPPRLR